MKKIKKMVLVALLIIPLVSVNNVKANAVEIPEETYMEEKVENAFDLSDPNSQIIVINDKYGNPITLTMSEELSPVTFGDIYIPNGSFDRVISATNGIYTMEARFQGTCNPYYTKLSKVSSGVFRGHLATLIQEKYAISSAVADPDSAVGLYRVVYTMPAIGGTYTATLEVYFWRGQSHAYAEAVVSYA